jgi:hypothetical protein
MTISVSRATLPCFIIVIHFNTPVIMGHVVAQLVEALHYKSEDRRFDSQWFH